MSERRQTAGLLGEVLQALNCLDSYTTIAITMSTLQHVHNFDALRAQYDHYLKLLDLFETRQTWTFNFAIGVYAAALAAVAPIFEKTVLPAALARKWTTEGDLAVIACSLLYSIALPLVILSLCYLYVDVSVFCAAMNAGTLPQFAKRFKEHGGLEIGDPGIFAFEWIDNQQILGNYLDIQNVANSRTIVFLLAPIAGLAVGLFGCILGLARFVFWGAGAVAGIGVLVSAIILYSSWKSCQKSHSARKLARTTRVGAARR